jgi:hypothetical protein
VHHFRGQAAEAAWRFDEATREYEEALRLNPNDAWLRLDMARLRMLSLDLAEARAQMRSVMQAEASIALLQRRSTNVSQTHYGQILDEFELDADALAAVTALREVAPRERSEVLLSVVRRFPDSTLAAICLLLALREAGSFVRSGSRRSNGASPIPKMIAQFWDSGDPPAEIRTMMNTWREWHPEHAFFLHDDTAAQCFLGETYTLDVLTAYRRAREPAQKADIFRLAWLFARGGYYVDADDRCFAPVGTIVPAHAELAVYQEDLGTLGNNFIGAVPRHPVIGLALDLAVDAVNRGDNDLLWLSTGPGLLTRAFARTLAMSRLNASAWLDGIAVLDRSELYRAVAIHCFTGYKKTERHWSQSAFARRKKAG